jgi:tRNA(Ile)-lysidine synthase
MAAARERPPPLPDPFWQLVAEPGRPPAVIAVACSGGLDSLALLHACCRAAKPLGLQVLALHVHHGLQPEADGWQEGLAARCARWRRSGAALRFMSRRLDGLPAPGDSIEAWARRARYDALREMALAEACRHVLLAHHRRDQAETFLLQALRGGGVAGLAAMPARAERAGVVWLRPWLHAARESIAAHARRHRLSWVEDPSNADPRHARNRLRLRVWPALSEAFPQAEQVLGDAAGWAAQASQGLRELAALDLAQAVDADALNLSQWSTLSPVRRVNLLRHWLQWRLGQPSPGSLIDRLAAELPTGTSGPAKQWHVPGGRLRAHRGRLELLACDPSEALMTASPGPRVERLSIRRSGRHVLPDWGGSLLVRRVREGGVPLAWLAEAELRSRCGGERFQAGPGRPPRSLKKQYQAAGVPVWQREGPMLYSGGQLVFVPGLGLDARLVGLPGQALVRLDWLPG